MTSQTVLPRWRGFNLSEFFGIPTFQANDFQEDDFRWMADWGFDFARIPMHYQLWIVDNDPFTVNESVIEKLDRVLKLGETYNIHISLNFHTAPGYRIGAKEPVPPGNLWKDQQALDAFCFQWSYFAQRYKGIPSNRLSFDLVNEPPNLSNQMSLDDFVRVTTAATNAIRAIDPDRLIISDGYGVGRIPCEQLAPLGIAQSTRAYDPHSVSHYLAPWANGMNYPLPQWPEPNGWNREKLVEFYEPWVKLAQSGVGVHCGEGGAFQHTPHDVFLAWFGDVLDILTEHNIGYALWSFRGAFGILDSGRKDVDYVDWHGHQLDEKLLRLLQAH